MNITRKTKIIATLGPASDNEKVLIKMIKAGVNIIRLNFSHSDYSYHENAIKAVRSASKSAGIPVAIMQDLQGPKIRTGELYKNKIFLKNGSSLTLTTKKCVGDESIQFISYKNLPKEVKKGNIILLDDGKIKLEVFSISGDDIKCKVIIGGYIISRRGVNVPGASLKISSLTTKDKKDVVWGVDHDVDFIAFSFVKNVGDVRELKNILKKMNADIDVISKIETCDAINNIDEIISETDGIMVARGDLAVEMPPEEVPMLQKMIIKKCNKLGKPVVVATQMLESMVSSPVPTRAEVSDVANSILDGADAVMLSAETAIGKHPISTIEIMSKVAKKTEIMQPHHHDLLAVGIANESVEDGCCGNVDAVTHYVVSTAHDVGAKVIVALTETGSTARMVARYHPMQPIIVLSPNERALKKVIISYGCYSHNISQFKYVGEATDSIRKVLLKERIAKKGDKFVLAAGVPFGKAGGTNMVMVQEV